MNYQSNKNYDNFDLTGELIGIAFEIYNEIGFGHREKVYHTAFEQMLIKKGFDYKRERYGKIIFDGKIVGRYFIDFVVENKVAIEFKVRNEIYQKDLSQLLDYLKSEKFKTGLLITLTKNGVKIKRLVNSIRENPRGESAVGKSI